MTISPFEQLLTLSRETVDALLETFPFVSEGEVETITGYWLHEYEELAQSIKNGLTLDQLSPGARDMIYHAALNVVGLPVRDDSIYRQRLGDDYRLSMNGLMDKLDSMGRRRTLRRYDS